MGSVYPNIRHDKYIDLMIYILCIIYIYIHTVYIYILLLGLMVGYWDGCPLGGHIQNLCCFFASNVHAVVYIHVCKSAILLGYISHERLYIILL